jgi:hypothetical protein
VVPLTQPLREEHKELLPHIEAVRVAGDAVGVAPPEKVQHLVEDAYTFLTHHLIPHAQAEDRALYPVVERAMAAPGATATMSRDHVEVGTLTAELGGLQHQLEGLMLNEAQAQALRRPSPFPSSGRSR